MSDFVGQYVEDVLLRGLAEARPGQIVGPDVEAIAGQAFAEVSGLSRDQYLSNPYGYPILPVPVGGLNRLPPELNVECAGHPVFWLDDNVARRRDDESEAHWAVRLFTELLFRNWWDPVEKDWFDVLHVAGFDLNDPVTRARVQAYVIGGPDPDLANLVIPEMFEGLDDLGAAARHADRVEELLGPVVDEVTDLASQEVVRAAEEARLLMMSDFDVLSREAVGALVTYQQAVASGQGLSVWADTSRVLHELNSRVDEIGLAYLDAVGLVALRAANDEYEYLNAVYAVADQIQAAENQRHQLFNTLLGRLRDNGRDDAAFKAVFDQLRDWHRTLVEDLVRAFEQVDRVIADRHWSVPDEVSDADEDALLGSEGGPGVPEFRHVTRPVGPPMKAGDLFVTGNDDEG